MQTNFPYDLSLKMDSNPSLPGLDSFINSLERIFYARAEVKLVTAPTGENQLILNLRCRMGLIDVLYHRNRGLWGPDSESGSPEQTNLLFQLVRELQSRNQQPVDLEELNLEFDDLLVVIRSIGPESISRELEKILDSLGEHYVHFTRGLQAFPYEIYIPVSDRSEPAAGLANDQGHTAFFDFWAVYYEQESDARVYSLKNRQLLAGDLYYSDTI